MYKKGGEDHAGFDGDGQVRKDRQRKGDDPDGGLGGSQLDDRRDFAPFSHVVGHDHENARENCQWNVSHEWCREQQHQQQGDGVRHAGHGRARA